MTTREAPVGTWASNGATWRCRCDDERSCAIQHARHVLACPECGYLRPTDIEEATREACAQVCERTWSSPISRDAAARCAAAIRAMGQTASSTAPSTAVCGAFIQHITHMETCGLPPNHGGKHGDPQPHDCVDCGWHHGVCGNCGTTHGEHHSDGCKWAR